MDASLLRVGKPVLEVVGDAGVESTDGRRGPTAHGREGSRRARSDEGRPRRLALMGEDGSAVAIGLEAALTRDVKGDE
jgi:hypothetical protein